MEKEKISGRAGGAAQASGKLAVTAGIWYIVSTMLSKGISFITVPFFTRIMPKASFGEFNNYTSWQSILLVIFGVELYNTVNKAYYDHRDTFDQYMSSVSVLGVVVGFALSAIMWVFQEQIASLLSISTKYIYILCVYLTIFPPYYLLLSKNRILYKYKATTLITLVAAVVSTGAAFILVSLAQDKLTARIYGQFVPMILLGAGCFVVLLYRGKYVGARYWGYALKLAVPLVCYYFCLYAMNSSSVTFSRRFYGAEITAVISLAVSCSHIITMLNQSINNAWAPWLYERLNQKKYKEVSRAYGGILAIYGFMVIGVMLLGPELTKILGGSNYAESTIFVPISLLLGSAQLLNTLYVNLMTYKKKTQVIMSVTMAFSVVCLLLKFLFVQWLPYEYIMYPDLIAYCGIEIVLTVITKRYYNVSVYPMRYIAAYIGSLAAVMLICRFLYAHIWVRIGVIAVYALIFIAIAYKYREQIMAFFKKKQVKAGTR